MELRFFSNYLKHPIKELQTVLESLIKLLGENKHSSEKTSKQIIANYD